MWNEDFFYLWLIKFIARVNYLILKMMHHHMNHNMKLHIAVKSELQIILKPKKNFFFLNFIFEIIF